MFDKELYLMELERLFRESTPKETAEDIIKYMAYDGAVGFAIVEQLHGGALEDLANEYFYGYCYRKIYKSPENEIEDIIYKKWIKEWMPIEYAFVPCLIAEGLKKCVLAFGEDNTHYRRIKDEKHEKN